MEEKYFVTSNYSLCGYLEINGLRYLKAEVIKDHRDKIKVEFTFLDPKNRGRDLEIEFRYSPEKKYKDSLFYYRALIGEKLGK